MMNWGGNPSTSIDGVGALFCFTRFITLIPDYTRILIPPTPELFYSLRKQNVVGQICARTASYEASFYPHCLSNWNKLDPEIRLSLTISAFKNILSSIIRTPPPPPSS